MKTFKDEASVSFADCNLSERGPNSAEIGAGSGGWPTIKYYNKKTGYGGAFYEQKTGGPVCSELLEDQYMEGYIKEASGLILNDPSADHMDRAYVLLDSDDHEGAIESFRAATRFAPAKFASETWYNLGVALTDEDARGREKAAAADARKEAAAAFKKAASLDPKNEEAQEELAKFKDEL